MPDTIVLPNGETLTLPLLPPHHHQVTCDCEAVCAYIRVSDLAGRDSNLVAPKIQLDTIVVWSKVKKKRIVKLIFDIDESGQTFDARKVGEAIEGFRTKSWATIALWKWSRWGRDLFESLDWLNRAKAAGGKVESATEDHDQETAHGILTRNLMLTLADHQGRVIGETWRGAHKNRRENGLPHSGRPRFGYDYVEVKETRIEDSTGVEKEYDVKRYVPNEHAEHLVAAYRNYAAGSSLRSLVKAWNAAGITTTAGKRWTPQALGKMLDTGFGAGLIRERSNPGKSPANRLASYDVWRAGVHEAVVDEATWKKYSDRRRRLADLPPRARTAAHAVSSLLFCGLCGRRLTTKYQGRSKTHQWACESRAAYHPDQHVGVSNALVLGFVRAWVQQRVGDTSQWVEDEIRRQASVRRAAADLTRLDKEIERFDRRLDAVLELHLDGGISRVKYDEKKDAYEGHLRELRGEREEARKMSESSGGHLQLAFTALEQEWDRYGPADHREALGALIAGVAVSPGRNKLELPSRVRVFPAWESEEFSRWLSACRTAAS